MYGDQRVNVTRYIPSSLESGTVVSHVCCKRRWFTTSPTVPNLLHFRVNPREWFIQSTDLLPSCLFYVAMFCVCSLCASSPLCSYAIQEFFQIALLCRLFTSSRPCGSTGVFQKGSYCIIAQYQCHFV